MNYPKSELGRVCKTCNTHKPSNQFGHEPRNRNGLKAICDSCNAIRTREWVAKNPEKRKQVANASAKKAYQKNPEKFLKRSRERRSDESVRAADRAVWAKAHKRRMQDPLYRENVKAKDRAARAEPEEAKKEAARDKLKYAIRSGKLKRLPCEKCGATPTHGHHHDYDKPLEVVWLCAPCHGKEHRKYD